MKKCDATSCIFSVYCIALVPTVQGCALQRTLIALLGCRTGTTYCTTHSDAILLYCIVWNILQILVILFLSLAIYFSLFCKIRPEARCPHGYIVLILYIYIIMYSCCLIFKKNYYELNSFLSMEFYIYVCVPIQNELLWWGWRWWGKNRPEILMCCIWYIICKPYVYTWAVGVDERSKGSKCSFKLW